MSRSKLGAQVAAGIGWTTLDKWASSSIAFLVFVILARLLDPVAFGLVALANVYLAFCKLFAEQGFTAALIQRKHLSGEHLDTAFWSTLALSAVLVLVSVLASGPVGRLFDEQMLQPIIVALSLNFIAQSLSSVQVSVLKRAFRFQVLARRNVLATAAGGVLGIALAIQGFGVWSLVGMSLANSVVGVLVLWSASSWRPGRSFSILAYRELLPFGVSVAGTNVVKFAGKHADKMLIGFFLSTEAVGVYKIAYNLVHQLSSTLSAIYSVVALPLFARLQSEMDKLNGAFSMFTKVSLITASPVFAVLAIHADQFVHLLFGPQWVSSVGPLRILAALGLLYTVTHFNEPMLFALGRPGLHFTLTLARSLTSVILVAIAVRFGVSAVALAVVAASYLNWPITMVVISRQSGLHLAEYVRLFVQSLVPTTCMAVVLLAFALTAAPRDVSALTGALLAAGLLHVAILWYLEEPFLRTIFRLVFRGASVDRAQVPGA